MIWKLGEGEIGEITEGQGSLVFLTDSAHVEFLCNFLSQFIRRDLAILGQYERRLMHLEEEVSEGNIQDFQAQIMPLRRELLSLRSYYDEMMDMGKDLEENEGHFFTKKNLKYFGALSDRADRLMSKTDHLLEYARQIRDACQSVVDESQNENMQFLTVISTIFYPLTLITGWRFFMCKTALFALRVVS